MANNSSVIVNEIRNSTYTNSDVLRFHLNENLQLLNPKDTFLRFNMVVGAIAPPAIVAGRTDANHYAPWGLDVATGTESLVKSIRIVSRKDGSVLEEITDYNLLAKKVGSYTQNESIEQMKKLYYGADTNDVRENNTLTERTAIPLDNVAPNNKKIECFLKLNLSGIFGRTGQLFPCFACPLELQIELESDSYKVLKAQGQFGLQGEDSTAFQGNRAFYSKSAGYGVVGTAGVGAAANVNTSNTMPYAVESVAGAVDAVEAVRLDNTVGSVPKANLTCVGTGLVLETAVATTQTNVTEQPFYAGQNICVGFVGDTSGNLNAVPGVVKKAAYDGVGAAMTIQVEFEATLALNADGGVTGGAGADNGYCIWITPPTSQPTINISDVELVCAIVKPDSAMISKYDGAINSGQGMGLAIQSWYDYPVNSSANALVVSNLVNCKLSRVKAILSWWQDVSSNAKMEEDSLRTPNNADIQARQYVYKLDGLQTPSRAISLTNTQRVRSAGAGWWSAQQTRETAQALKECGFQVRDLSNCSLDLLIGRAFTRFPNTYSLADLQGELRLDLQFTTNTKNLLHHNFVCYTKTILVQPSGVRVLE